MAKDNNTQLVSNTIPYQGIVFTPNTEFSPVAPDYSILERSFARQEERANRAADERQVLQKALADAKVKLHRDPETQQFVQDLENQLFAPINAAAGIGDYHTAIVEAKAAAGNLLENNDLLSRIQDNEDYENYIKSIDDRVKTGQLSQETAEYAKFVNQYNHTTNRDSQGNVIGGNKWKPVKEIYDDLDFFKLYKDTATSIAPEAGSTSGEHVDKDESGNVKVDANGGVWVRGSSNKWEKLSEERIITAVHKRVSEDPKLMRQLVQDLEKTKFILNKLKDEIDSCDDPELRREKQAAYDVLYDRLHANGSSSITPSEWLNSQLSLFAPEFAYNHRFTTSSDNYSAPKRSGNEEEENKKPRTPKVRESGSAEHSE